MRTYTFILLFISAMACKAAEPDSFDETVQSQVIEEPAAKPITPEHGDFFEKEVRFVALIDTGSSGNWDAHGDMMTHVPLARNVDQPIAEQNSEQEKYFEARVRPMLLKHCYDCHGPELAEGKLRLDTRSGWERGGERGPAIVPGDPSSSLLIRAVSHVDEKLQMPPGESGDKLSDAEIEDLRIWIRQGAYDPRSGEKIVTDIEKAAREHWAFQPIAPPTVEGDVHPIDFLIERRLREQNFTVTAAADRCTLVRRTTFDLIGLPPTAQQLATTREGYPQLVKELLASHQYGERWGRHWLDVARYSDAKDGVLMYGDARIRPFAYTYRDYVIRAFNDDKPFDQFVREQLAADQLNLPADSPDLAAMGLLTLGRMFDRNRHDVIDDQIDVIGRGFLGLSLACARCHDHKFDPVPTADYYSLYGVFASCIEPYDGPRIGPVTEAGQAFEQEFAAKLKEIEDQQATHYAETLETARERTPDLPPRRPRLSPDRRRTRKGRQGDPVMSEVVPAVSPSRQVNSRTRQSRTRRAYDGIPVRRNHNPPATDWKSVVQSEHRLGGFR